jgi:hypothetical protein
VIRPLPYDSIPLGRTILPVPNALLRCMEKTQARKFVYVHVDGLARSTTRYIWRRHPYGARTSVCSYRAEVCYNTISTYIYISSFANHYLTCYECIKSIYESTTFIFTDVIALDLFAGFCRVPKVLEQDSNMAISPPGFRSFGRHVDLSLEPVFPMLLPCSSPVMTPQIEEHHECLDLHGLRLGRLENLTTLDIWISVRSTTVLLENDSRNNDQSPYNVTQLSIWSLKEVLEPLSHVKKITLSMPPTFSYSNADREEI